MKIQEIHRKSAFAWSPDGVPLLATGSVAGSVNSEFSSASVLEIWAVFGGAQTPVLAANVDHKFHALAWSRPFDGRPRGVLAGAFETGAVHFWDADVLLRTRSPDAALVHSSSKHTGAVKCLQFHPQQPHVLATGGPHGEIYVWDAKTFAEPFAPGTPITPMDEISSVAWNNAMGHILASTSNAGYTSIWDLKAKREVMHLSYSGPLGRADFSAVAWHPTQSTLLVTASQSDACPALMLWDVKTAAQPELVMEGHAKGVLSLDWCTQDPNLLVSCGKDKTTILWNPMTGTKLGEYPAAASWSFSTAFAPRAPDVIATASFDEKIVVQTLQDTSPPEAATAQAADDDSFWSTIATTDTQKAHFDVVQAPAWMKRPCSATFAFGSKLITVRNAGAGTVSLERFVTENASSRAAAGLSAALKADDFSALISAKLDAQGLDHADWQALSELREHGKEHFLEAIVGPPEEAAESSDLTEENGEENFFASLSKDIQAVKNVEAFAPSGEFTIIDDSQSDVDAKLAKLLLANKIGEAVDVCLQEGKVAEALVLALDQDDSTKNKVKNRYFKDSSNVLSRLIYSASAKNVVDIVSNADISNWKEIASSIAAYCDDREFNIRIVELGDRVMASDPYGAESRANALKCYLAGNALDKVSAMWLGGVPELERSLLAGDAVSSAFDARFMALAAFVEKFAVYKSIANIEGTLSGAAIEPVCNAILDFANMSATSGFFDLADQFMSLLPEDLAGLKIEKDRLAHATAKAPAAKQPAAKQAATKTQNRYAAPQFASSSLQQAKPRVKSPRAAYAAPSTAPINPYAQRPASSFSGGASVSGNGTFAGAPVPAAPRTRGNSFAQPAAAPVLPPAGPSFVSTNQQNTYPAASPASVAPSMLKAETDGWNDLPDSFKAPKPPVRRTPAPAVPASPVAAAAPMQPPKRQLAQPMAPPPPRAVSRAPSTASVSTLSKTEVKPSNKYAPAVSSASPAPNGPNGANGHSATTSPVLNAKVAAPPKNPYAISAPNAAPAKTSYAPPPTNNFVPPAPPAMSRSVSQVNPYSPPATNPPVAARRSVSSRSRQGSQSSAFAPPMSRQATGNMVPPPPIGSRPPPSRTPTLSARTPTLPAESKSDSRSFSPAAAYSPQSQGPRTPGPPVRPGPPRAAQSPAPPLAPPIKKAPAQAPAQPQAPPQAAAQAPPKASAQSAPFGQPPAAAPPVQTQPAGQSAGPFGQSTQSDLFGKSEQSGHSDPFGQSTPAQPAPAPPAQPAPAQPAPAQPASAQSGESIKTGFSKVLSSIKPAAPPKYTKHVADMEKRLNILFDKLTSPGSLSGECVEALTKVAAALGEKDYGSAAALNQDISSNHPAEIGDWHTGVKRLVTMAEAFEA